jgi:hypothetical protein
MADTSDNTPNYPADTQMGGMDVDDAHGSEFAFEDSLDMGDEGDPIDAQSIDDSGELEDDYDDLVEAQEKAESEAIATAITEETERVRETGDFGEVMADGVISKESLQRMKSLYVTDPAGNVHHKKSLLKDINSNRKLTKSFDRNKRVRDEARKGYSSAGVTVNSAVTRAFQFSHDTSAGINSGSDRLNSDDYCCVMIKPPKGRAHMVVAKFQRFGMSTCLSPLELSWEKSKADYRASLIPLKVIECEDSNSQKCLQSTGQVLASLRCVHSSCIHPISPTLESEEKQPGVIVTYAKMKVAELTEVFSVLSSRQLHHRPKNEHDMDPVEVDESAPFIVITSSTNAPADTAKSKNNHGNQI